MDNEQLIKLRDRIWEIPGFADRLAELERFCIANSVGCLSGLCFHEWATNEYGDSGLGQNLVPMLSATIEERAAFRDWAVTYYKRTNPMATVEGRIQWFEAKAAKAPDRAELVDAELKKTKSETDLWGGAFAVGQRAAREGDALDFADYHAYSPEVLAMLLGYANFHYLLFLKRGQNSTAGKAETPDAASEYAHILANLKSHKPLVRGCTDEEINRIAAYVKYVEENGTTPVEVVGIVETKLPNKWLFHTFYLIKQAIDPTQNKPLGRNLIGLMRKLFVQLNPVTMDISRKWSAKPTGYPKNSL